MRQCRLLLLLLLSLCLQPTLRGHIVFGADPITVGVSVGAGVGLDVTVQYVSYISLTDMRILIKLVIMYHWNMPLSSFDIVVLDLVFKVSVFKVSLQHRMSEIGDICFLWKQISSCCYSSSSSVSSFLSFLICLFFLFFFFFFLLLLSLLLLLLCTVMTYHEMISLKVDLMHANLMS